MTLIKINKLDNVLKNKILKQTKNLEGTFEFFFV